MNPLRTLALVFLLMAAYGMGMHKYAPAVICLGMVGFVLYGDKKFKHQDAVWEKEQAVKRSLTMASERMLALYECEASVPCVHNPMHDMQVAD